MYKFAVNKDNPLIPLKDIEVGSAFFWEGEYYLRLNFLNYSFLALPLSGRRGNLVTFMDLDKKVSLCKDVIIAVEN